MLWESTRFRDMGLTFFTIVGIDSEVKVGAITEAALDDDVALELKDGYGGTVELDSCWLLLRLELEEYGRGHFGCWCMCYKGLKVEGVRALVVPSRFILTVSHRSPIPSMPKGVGLDRTMFGEGWTLMFLRRLF